MSCKFYKSQAIEFTESSLMQLILIVFQIDLTL